MERLFEVIDGSYSQVPVGDEKFVSGNGNYLRKELEGKATREFKILAKDCVLPIKGQGIKTPNDTIIQNIVNDEIVFIRYKHLNQVYPLPEEMVTIDDREYSISTIKAALREYTY